MNTYTSNRYIIRTLTLQANNGETFYLVRISCGAGTPRQMAKRLGKVNGQAEFEKRIAELDAINAEYRVLFFGGDREACQYTRDTTEYLNRGRELPYWLGMKAN